MASKTDEKSVREKLDEILHQKNYVTDGLEFVEKKTGVNRLYIVLGKYEDGWWPKSKGS